MGGASGTRLRLQEGRAERRQATAGAGDTVGCWCEAGASTAWQRLALFWKRLSPLRSLKISRPSLPVTSFSSLIVTGRVARHVREAWEGSEKGSCRQRGKGDGGGKGPTQGEGAGRETAGCVACRKTAEQDVPKSVDFSCEDSNPPMLCCPGFSAACHRCPQQPGAPWPDAL